MIKFARCFARTFATWFSPRSQGQCLGGGSQGKHLPARHRGGWCRVLLPLARSPWQLQADTLWQLKWVSPLHKRWLHGWKLRFGQRLDLHMAALENNRNCIYLNLIEWITLDAVVKRLFGKAEIECRHCCMKMRDKTYGSHQLPLRWPAGLLV